MTLDASLVSTPTPFDQLPARQQQIVSFVRAYMAVTGEPCSASQIARKLGISRQAVGHLLVRLYRRGWLRTDTSPARLMELSEELPIEVVAAPLVDSFATPTQL